MESHIPLSEPCIQGNEWKYIKECLDSGWVSSVGSYVAKFEEIVADYIGRKYAVAVTNGTAALHVSLMACGVESNDEVIVPSLTFIATANVVKYCGASPVFMDCDENFGLNVEKLIAFINNNSVKKKDGFSYNRNSGKKIKAIIPVHIFGHPVDMDPLSKVCNEYNISIIEDACESLGSLYKGKKIGSFGQVACFSFNGNKIITTGGGGMVTTDDEHLAKRIRHLTTQAKIDSIEYDHDEIGYNYRMTNIQAALGVAQMENVDKFVEIKRRNAEIYKNLLSKHDIQLLWEQSWAKSNFWFYTIKVPKEHKDSLMNYLISKNVQVRPIWKPIHLLIPFREDLAIEIDEAMMAHETCLNIPCSVNLKREQMERVSDCIRGYFKKVKIY